MKPYGSFETTEMTTLIFKHGTVDVAIRLIAKRRPAAVTFTDDCANAATRAERQSLVARP
jgi:hypothetical protein